MKVGNVSLNPEAFKDWTKEQFFAEYAGKLDLDKEEVWKEIQEANKKETYFLPKDIGQALGLKEVKNASSDKPGKSGKKSDS